MKGIAVSMTVNGDAVEYVCHGRETLLDVLRNHLGLIGAKEGCGTGDCGACSVMMDGTLVCSCLVLAVETDGKSIDTIEGMAKGDELHPLQRHFPRSMDCNAASVRRASSLLPRRFWTITRIRRSRKSAMRWRAIFAGALVMTKL